jgi:hypothetical protein
VCSCVLGEFIVFLWMMSLSRFSQVVLPDAPTVLQDPVLLRIPELKALGSMVDILYANSAAAGAATTLNAPIGSEQYRKQQAALLQVSP